ncbi:G patch domain-containing protein 11 isoform X2 [Musca domestica]|uniref:G patch domain-containing protein 11 n=1 Tax=Musca domestica TaxID=7370 RepID=A0A1I8MZ74_MUSDO|nr:G patch domain-containing protein 11 isoform X2 [Musca domestica]
MRRKITCRINSWPAEVRPSLIHNRAKKRQLMVETKQKEHIKKQRESKAQSSPTVSNEKLQEALSKPLETDNKGFKLLAKMGYKPGQALGKVVEKEKPEKVAGGQPRLLEPIGITIKSDRQGLGRESALRELMEKQIELRKQRLQKEIGATTIEAFRKRATERAEERFVTTSLRRCQQTCQNLDVENHIETPDMPWFWPDVPKDQDETNAESVENPDSESEDETSEEFSAAEKLEMLTNYIRTSYNFCFWCGIRYEDQQDLNENCPGLNKDDH